MTTIKENLTTRRMAFCGIFAALTGICTQIAIPLPMIPINLALFSVYLSGCLLGARLGALSQIVYALLGAVGLPVFSGFSGGVSRLAGPTGGYILGYIAAAWLAGLLTDKWGRRFWRLCAAMALGLAACYLLGTLWFLFLTGKGLLAALTMCVFPFLPGDAVKIAAAALVVRRLDQPLRTVLEGRARS